MKKHILPIDLLKALLEEYRRQSPLEFEELIRSTEFNANPVPVCRPLNSFTWLGNEAALDELYQHTVVREEIFSVSNKEIFFQHLTGEDIPKERLVINHLKGGDALYIFNRLRERSIRLIAPDAYLHLQVVFHCTGEHGPLNANSLRKMISRGCIQSVPRREGLDLIIENILWANKSNRKE